jgi:hypothetical protein
MRGVVSMRGMAGGIVLYRFGFHHHALMNRAAHYQRRGGNSLDGQRHHDQPH